MKVLEVGKIGLTELNMEWFNRPGYEMTGETVTIGWSNDTASRQIVFRGDWTRFNTVRDCGDHWIFAGYTGYTRIDKNTFEITPDVDDM